MVASTSNGVEDCGCRTFDEENLCQESVIADENDGDGLVSSHMAADVQVAYGDSLVDDEVVRRMVTKRKTLDQWPDGGSTKWTRMVRLMSSVDG